MKYLLTLITSIISISGYSQNFQCFQQGVTRFFENKFVRAIFLDSVVTTTDAIIYYPFQSLRISSWAGITVDTAGGWLGKKVTVLNDGTSFFENYWGDTVIIYTQAPLNTSWTFYDDTSSRYYIATVSAVDTERVLGMLDTVKTIVVTSYLNGVIDPNDKAHGISIKLSKNYGLYQTFSLYMFPFRPSNSSVYQYGRDWLMDELDIVNGKVATYTLFRDDMFTESSMFDFAPGDLIQYKKSVYNSPIGPPSQIWLSDSVISKTVTGSVITYQIARVTNYTTTQYTKQVSNTPILNYIPEYLWSTGRIQINFTDKKFCMTSPTITMDGDQYPLLVFEPCGIVTTYKKGLGIVDFSRCTDPVGMGEIETLTYYRKNGVSCGTFIPITSVNNPETVHPYKIYPNPASDYLFISGPQEDRKYLIHDLSGKKIAEGQLGRNTQVDVRSYNEGLYFLIITDQKNLQKSFFRFLIER